MRILFTCILLLLTEVAFSQQQFEILIKNESIETVHFWFRDTKDSLSGNQTIKLSNETSTGYPFYFYVRVPDSKPGEFVLSKFWLFEPGAKRVLTIQPDKAVWFDSSADEVKLQKYLVASTGFNPWSGKYLMAPTGPKFWSVTRKFIKENRNNEIAAHAIALNLLYSSHDVSTIEQQYRKLTPEAKVGWAAKTIENYLAGRKLLSRGNIIPEFELTDLAGNSVTLQSSNSKYTLLYFWVPQCSSCKWLFPELKELYKNTDRSKLEIAGIFLSNSPEEFESSVSEHQLPWVNLFDSDASYTFGTLNMRSLPTKLLVDASGKIVRVNPKPSEVEAFIRRK